MARLFTPVQNNEIRNKNPGNRLSRAKQLHSNL